MPYSDANTRIPRRLSITSLAKALLGGITSALANATTTDVPVGYIAIVTDEGNSLQTQQMGPTGATALQRGVGRASGTATYGPAETSKTVTIPLGITASNTIILTGIGGTAGSAAKSCHLHVDNDGELTLDLNFAPGAGEAAYVHYFIP